MSSLPFGGTSSLRQIKPGGEVEYTQYVHKLLVPFSFEDTCTNMWKTCKLPHRQFDRQVYKGASDSDNTIGFKFHLKKILASGLTVSILKRVLVRRFIEIDRAVFVWRNFCEGEGIFSGMDAEETAWISIRPYSDGSKHGALMEICSRQVPAPFMTGNTSVSTVEACKDMLRDAVNEDEREIARSLEKLLLDDVLESIEVDQEG